MIIDKVLIFFVSMGAFALFAATSLRDWITLALGLGLVVSVTFGAKSRASSKASSEAAAELREALSDCREREKELKSEIREYRETVSNLSVIIEVLEGEGK